MKKSVNYSDVFFNEKMEKFPLNLVQPCKEYIVIFVLNQILTNRNMSINAIGWQKIEREKQMKTKENK